MSKERNEIVVKGACEHNLKNLDVSLPKNKLIVITGVSGSGKSSLAFDTIFAEGQRRYIESLSSYARQFIGQIQKPAYESIRGLAPTISIEQKSAITNPRSTVGTITEIYDYLRVFFARIGQQHCHICGKPVQKGDAQNIVNQVLAMEEGTKFYLLSPVIKMKKGQHNEIFEKLMKEGLNRVRVDGIVVFIRQSINILKKFLLFFSIKKQDFQLKISLDFPKLFLTTISF